MGERGDSSNNEAHNHSGHNHSVQGVSGKKILIATLMNIVITIAEIIGGLLSGSLSLLSDAMHNFSDGVSLVVSYLAVKISGKGADYKRTFGYKRTGVIAAVFNSVTLIVISVLLIKEAYNKFINPEDIKGEMVVVIATIGLVSNIVAMIILRSDSKKSLNIKSAYLHLLGDALSSVAVVVGGVLMTLFDLFWLDSVLTVLINLYIIRECYRVVKESLNILMQGAPENIDIQKINDAILAINDIEDIHHIHLWSLDEKNVNFEAHINLKNDILVSQTVSLNREIEKILKEKFKITHSTICFEYKCCEGTGILKV
ncbi:MAG TPA: cation diffusion facilitator family transporter [Spirochaetota bacterium]|nr:cation diffusion facilitator family transporter [Spirochaetota bacterium]HOS33234.1 cation diffusion facilitator family transporter [Spirochaetota bacterium]HOS56478.1 cation diffusion facilitator family transporter [Spirochaetota bacterium]HPK61313.1 cation diffusion facilitator family transporter [Spirochaetota bacterium]HQF78734.1 cation diffusion facilitator family transporter [Spirochaetota bacterium]